VWSGALGCHNASITLESVGSVVAQQYRPLRNYDIRYLYMLETPVAAKTVMAREPNKWKTH
jgi:hypothetical protein